MPSTRSSRAGGAIARAQASNSPTSAQVKLLQQLCVELGMDYIKPLDKAEAATDIDQLLKLKWSRQ